MKFKILERAGVPLEAQSEENRRSMSVAEVEAYAAAQKPVLKLAADIDSQAKGSTLDFHEGENSLVASQEQPLFHAKNESEMSQIDKSLERLTRILDVLEKD